LPLPFPAARLEHAYGSLLRRTGARRGAVEHLRRAHDGLSSLGATPFVADCEAELAACGLQAPAADTSGVLQLTPAEQAVARLVSQGLTNREAAAQLYVSPKTVDYHLGHIYAKLGITSRRELLDRIRPSGS
jgi:DNA-binding CsgD family transcriptional regulator